MGSADLRTLSEDTRASLQDLQASLGRLERRDWWLWGTSVLLLVLICGAVAALSISITVKEDDIPFQLSLDVAWRGLLAIVLLFAVYVIYQQFLIKGLRRRLTEQIGVATSLGERAEKFERLALLDPLTELYNRRFVMDQLQREIERSERLGHPLIALMLEVEGLKSINDQYGSRAADQALVSFAERLRKSVRSSDSPARLDGDKFLVILPECHQELVPRALARVSGLEAGLNGRQVPIRFSAGWVSYQPEESREQLLRRAEEALQQNRESAEVEEQIHKAKSDLRQAQKMEAMGRLAGGIAHDFNNFLSVIRGYTELLRDQLVGDNGQRHLAEKTLQAADSAIALTRQLLAFSRSQELQPQVVDVNAVIRNMESMLGRVIPESIELALDLDDHLAPITADPSQLEQILMNLCTNARDSMPGGGKLSVRTANVNLDQHFVREHRGAQLGSYVQLTVSDTGEGMDPVTRERIFEPFFTTKPKGKGTGLGLASVYGIIKQSNGYVTVESEAGAGSTFKIYFPQVSDRADEATSPAEAAAQRS